MGLVEDGTRGSTWQERKPVENSQLDLPPAKEVIGMPPWKGLDVLAIMSFITTLF